MTEIKRFVRELLQLRPDALEKFEQIAADSEIVAVYYDLSNEVTPALFVILNENGREVTDLIRLEGANWKRG